MPRRLQPASRASGGRSTGSWSRCFRARGHPKSPSPGFYNCTHIGSLVKVEAWRSSFGTISSSNRLAEMTKSFFPRSLISKVVRPTHRPLWCQAQIEKSWRKSLFCRCLWVKALYSCVCVCVSVYSTRRHERSNGWLVLLAAKILRCSIARYTFYCIFLWRCEHLR